MDTQRVTTKMAERCRPLAGQQTRGYQSVISEWWFKLFFLSPPNRQNTKDIHTLAQLISAYSLVDTDKAKSYPLNLEEHLICFFFFGPFLGSRSAECLRFTSESRSLTLPPPQPQQTPSVGGHHGLQRGRRRAGKLSRGDLRQEKSRKSHRRKPSAQRTGVHPDSFFHLCLASALV